MPFITYDDLRRFGRAAGGAKPPEAAKNATCPSCGGDATVSCRCGTQHQRCANGHDWVKCATHGPTLAHQPADGSHPTCEACLHKASEPKDPKRQEAARLAWEKRGRQANLALFMVENARRLARAGPVRDAVVLARRAADRLTRAGHAAEGIAARQAADALDAGATPEARDTFVGAMQTILQQVPEVPYPKAAVESAAERAKAIVAAAMEKDALTTAELSERSKKAWESRQRGARAQEPPEGEEEIATEPPEAEVDGEQEEAARVEALAPKQRQADMAQFVTDAQQAAREAAAAAGAAKSPQATEWAEESARVADRAEQRAKDGDYAGAQNDRAYAYAAAAAARSHAAKATGRPFTTAPVRGVAPAIQSSERVTTQAQAVAAAQKDPKQAKAVPALEQQLQSIAEDQALVTSAQIERRILELGLIKPAGSLLGTLASRQHYQDFQKQLNSVQRDIKKRRKDLAEAAKARDKSGRMDTGRVGAAGAGLTQALRTVQGMWDRFLDKLERSAEQQKALPGVWGEIQKRRAPPPAVAAPGAAAPGVKAPGVREPAIERWLAEKALTPEEASERAKKAWETRERAKPKAPKTPLTPAEWAQREAQVAQEWAEDAAQAALKAPGARQHAEAAKMAAAQAKQAAEHGEVKLARAAAMVAEAARDRAEAAAKLVEDMQERAGRADDLAENAKWKISDVADELTSAERALQAAKGGFAQRLAAIDLARHLHEGVQAHAATASAVATAAAEGVLDEDGHRQAQAQMSESALLLARARRQIGEKNLAGAVAAAGTAMEHLANATRQVRDAAAQMKRMGETTERLPEPSSEKPEASPGAGFGIGFVPERGEPAWPKTPDEPSTPPEKSLVILPWWGKQGTKISAPGDARHRDHTPLVVSLDDKEAACRA